MELIVLVEIQKVERQQTEWNWKEYGKESVHPGEQVVGAIVM